MITATSTCPRLSTTYPSLSTFAVSAARVTAAFDSFSMTLASASSITIGGSFTERISERTSEERVQAGAALLDAHFADYTVDWIDRIDLDRLDISCGCCCVLGQVFGVYGDGIAMLDLTDALMMEKADYGFLDTRDRDAWVQLITARRAQLSDGLAA